MKKFCFLFIIFFISIVTISAQENVLSNGTINENFDLIIKKSNNYQDFKVVKKNDLYKIKKQVLDSLKDNQVEKKSLNKIIENQNSSISELENKISTLNNTIEKANSNVENINFLGANLTKKSFKSIFWLSLITITILLCFFIYKFKRSNTVTLETKEQLTDIEKEFEKHKKVALEREQKVMRKLQDELNKNRN